MARERFPERMTAKQLVCSAANEGFIEALVDARVRFLVVGGLAVSHYVPERSTEDLDIWLGQSDANVRKAHALLVELVAPLGSKLMFGASALGARRKQQLPIKQHYNIDILTQGPEMDFTSAWRASSPALIGPFPVRIASISTLLEMLALSEQPKHIADITSLQRALLRLG